MSDSSTFIGSGHLTGFRCGLPVRPLAMITVTLGSVFLVTVTARACQKSAELDIQAEEIVVPEIVNTLQRTASRTLGDRQLWSDIHFSVAGGSGRTFSRSTAGCSIGMIAGTPAGLGKNASGRWKRSKTNNGCL